MGTYPGYWFHTFCIEAVTLTPSNAVHGRLHRSGRLPWDPHYGLVRVYLTKQLAVDIGESKLGDLNA